MTVGAASTDGNLAPVGVLGKLQVGRLYASDVDAVTARRDAGAWLMLGAALCGCDSWRVDARAVEEAAGVCSRTVARAVARLLLEEVWRELELGRYARGPAWGQPAGPWCEVGPRLLELLEGLGAHPTGLTALRVGLYVLPRLRGARAARAAVCSMTNGRIAGELRMGRTQLTEALRRLEPLGLRCIQGTALRATEDGWRRDPRRVSTSSAPWSHEDWSPPRQKQPNPPQQPPNPDPFPPGGPDGDRGGLGSGQDQTEAVRPCTDPNPPSIAPRAGGAPDRKGARSARGFDAGRPTAGEELEAPEEAHRPAGLERGGGGPAVSGRSPVLWGGALAAAEYLAAELGLEGDRLSRLALCAGSEAKARAWVESEAPMLQARDVRNPAGLFWWLFRHAESLPGSPSDMARRRALEVAQARRLDAWHGRRGLEAPAPAGEIPEALREWYQAAGLVERLAELERPAPAAAFAALERRICREALEELLGELEAAPADLPRYHGAELERWRRALEESKALEARRAARAEAERAELEAFAAERPELLEAPAPRPSSSSPAPRPSSSSPAPRPSSSAPTGEALALGDATVTRAELERLGGGSWAKGLRVLVASRGLTRQNAGRGGSDYVRDF